jgi:hypothetical protein
MRGAFIRSFALAFAAAAAVLPVSALAEHQPPPLTAGQSYRDVLMLWGPPDEKIEMESRRRDIWKYPNGQAVFENGRVVAWNRADTTSPPGAQARVKRDEKRNEPANSRTVTQDNPNLIDEIMNELPSEGPVPSGPSAPGMPPGMPGPGGMIQPPPPPHG